jgi:polyisoprenoid-binding protein YceI
MTLLRRFTLPLPFPLLALTLALAGAVSAEDRWTVVPGQSSIRFAGTSTLHDFAGTAAVTAGSFSVAAGAVGGSIVVDATTMDTKDKERDAEMHHDHMESAKFPLIRFDLTAFTRSAAGGSATGSWTMHGVSRQLTVPVTLQEGANPTLTASFPIDMRDWSITPPRKFLVVSVDPTITVTISLALTPGAAAVVAPAAHHDLAGLSLSDHLGQLHDLGAEAHGRLAMLFTIEQRITARDWDDSLSAQLPPARALLRILDGSAIKAEDHQRLIDRITSTLDGSGVRFILDWQGAVRQRLGTPNDRVTIAAFDATGAHCGQVDGEASAQTLTKALGMVGIVPDPPLKDAASGRGRVVK